MRKIIILLLTFLSFATISYAIEGPDTNYIDFYQKEYNRAYKNYEKAQNDVNDLMEQVNSAIQAAVSGIEPDGCTHNCATCKGCH